MATMLFSDMPVGQMYDKWKVWEEMADQKWWVIACDALSIYEPPPPSLTLSHKDRKWEVVSAYQKSVRRGDVQQALRMVSAMCSIPEELPYFWRRVCTTAAEDVGPGCREAMNFVICASMVYTPKAASDFQYKVLSFLTELMCAADRSRDYCMMSIIESQIKEGVMPKDLPESQHLIIKAITEVGDDQHWAMKNNWRGEGMLRFQVAAIPKYSVIKLNNKAPTYTILKGLPAYSYDMHTRVGKGVLVRLTGCKATKDFFSAHPTIMPKQNALGWAMFFEEGGVISDQQLMPTLAELEQRFVAARFGYSLARWSELRGIMRKLLDEGVVDKLRIKVLNEQPY